MLEVLLDIATKRAVIIRAKQLRDSDYHIAESIDGVVQLYVCATSLDARSLDVVDSDKAIKLLLGSEG